jgi:hypothetical protein
MRSRNDIGKFLNRRGLLGSGVEVGVARGDFSRVILDHWQGQRLYLVDCWTPQDRFDYQDIAAFRIPSSFRRSATSSFASASRRRATWCTPLPSA